MKFGERNFEYKHSRSFLCSSCCLLLLCTTCLPASYLRWPGPPRLVRSAADLMDGGMDRMTHASRWLGWLLCSDAGCRLQLPSPLAFGWLEGGQGRVGEEKKRREFVRQWLSGFGQSRDEASFSFQKYSHSSHYIKYSNTYMKY